MDYDCYHLDTTNEDLCQLYDIETPQYEHETSSRISDDDSITSESLLDLVNSQLVIVRETTSGQVLWKCPIEEVDKIANHLVERDNIRYRLPCHSFRSLLLPMRESERPPVRSSNWLRCCMRGLFFASWYSFNQQADASTNTARFRFPEMAYCWFTDDEKMTNDDDKDKWAFYHGIKLLANEDAEGWILYQLMDDTQGEHFLSFLFQTMNVIKKHMALSWNDKLGLYSRMNAVTSKLKFREALNALGRSLDEPVSSLCEAFWLPNESAHAAINDLFDVHLIKSHTTIEDLHQKLDRLAVNLGAPSVELFSFVQMTMKAYLVQMQKHFTLIRLMFDTASNGTLTDFYNEPKNLPPKPEFDINPLVGYRELHKIMKTLWPNISIQETSIVYREAHDMMHPQSQWGKPNPDGIWFDSFVTAADRRCLFSQLRKGH